MKKEFSAIAVIAALLVGVIPFASITYAQDGVTPALTTEEIEIEEGLKAAMEAAVATLSVVEDDVNVDYASVFSNVAWIDADTTSAIFADCPPGMKPTGGQILTSNGDLNQIQSLAVGVDTDVAAWLGVIENEDDEDRHAAVVGAICIGDLNEDVTVNGDDDDEIENITINEGDVTFITEITNIIKIRQNNTTVINNNTTIINNNNTNVTGPGGNTTDPGGNTTDPGGNTTDPGTGGNTTAPLTATTEELTDPGTETPVENTTSPTGGVDTPSEPTLPPVFEEEETTPPVTEEETTTTEEEETDTTEEETTDTTEPETELENAEETTEETDDNDNTADASPDDEVDETT